MNTRVFALVFLLLPALIAPAIRAQDAPPAAPSGSPSDASEPKTPLAKDMRTMNSAIRKLRHQIGDAGSNASSLDLVAQIRATAVSAAGETPAWASDKPEADRAKFVADFESEMKEFVGKVDALAAALKANDNAAAAKLFKGLLTAERAGHKEFRKPHAQ